MNKSLVVLDLNGTLVDISRSFYRSVNIPYSQMNNKQYVYLRPLTKNLLIMIENEKSCDLLFFTSRILRNAQEVLRIISHLTGLSWVAQSTLLSREDCISESDGRKIKNYPFLQKLGYNQIFIVDNNPNKYGKYANRVYAINSFDMNRSTVDYQLDALINVLADWF